MSETLAFLELLHEFDATVPARVSVALPAIARAADALAARLSAGGRWVYAGAGTSGRLAVLDAAEIPPTFGTDPSMVSAILAGGERAITQAVEGAEDDGDAASRELDALAICERDAVVGVAASGGTPFTCAAVRHARERGALTVGVSCTPDSPLERLAELAVVVDVGPEALAGSTRLKAGSAQKIVLNMLSTAVMKKLGRIWRGEMVAMRPTNAKLKARAVRIAVRLLGLTEVEAEERLRAAGWNLPVALVAARWGTTEEAARARLDVLSGDVTRALDEAP